MDLEKLKNVGALADKMKIKIGQCKNDWKAALSTALTLGGGHNGFS